MSPAKAVCGGFTPFMDVYFLIVHGSVYNYTKHYPYVASSLLIIVPNDPINIRLFFLASIPCNINSYIFFPSPEITFVVTKSTTLQLVYLLNFLQYIHHSLILYREYSLLSRYISHEVFIISKQVRYAQGIRLQAAF